MSDKKNLYITSLFMIIAVIFTPFSHNPGSISAKILPVGEPAVSKGRVNVADSFSPETTSVPMSTPTPIGTSIPTRTPTEPVVSLKKLRQSISQESSGDIWYVAPGGDDEKDCLSPSNACASINGALEKAVSDDTIYVAGGTYTGTGDQVLFINKSVTLSGGWDLTFTMQSETTIIDGEDSRRGIEIGTYGSNCAIDHFTVTNAYFTHNGGGIAHYGGTLTLSNSTISGNVSWTDSAKGGGIYNGGTMTVDNCLIDGNTSDRGGGGIYNNGTMTLMNSTVSNNSAGINGGGGINNQGTMTITNSTISENINGWDWGKGGGIYNENLLTLTNSTISGNSTTGYMSNGGGIYNTDTLRIYNSTITNNSANGSGGISGSATLRNTILAGNIANNRNDCGGPILSAGYNIIGDTLNCNFISAAGDLTDTDPLLGPLQDNGGLTDTHALLSGSPAIDSGNPATPGSGGNACEATDQRGLSRPLDGDKDGNALCDIGSYEAPEGTTLLMDGGFELGSPNPVWAEYSTNFGTPLCTVGICGYGGGTGPHSGNWWSWFGGVDGTIEEGYVYQIVNLPPGSKSLIFWLEIPTPSGGGSDFLRVTLNGNIVFSVTDAQAASYPTYTPLTIDVSPYCGTQILQLYSKTYGAAITNFFVDNVGIGLIEETIFCDVLPDHWAKQWIEALYDSGITSGCSTDPPSYCPESSVTRAQMAVFLERGMRGSGFSPPLASGTVFEDVPASHWAAAWIEQLAADGITGGCSTDPPLYCPESSVTRAQMAIFLERAMHWPTPYSPPPASGTVFDDVPVSHWAAAWIEQLAADGITGGCSASPPMYCPESPVTRAQMAVFLVRTFGLPLP